MGQEEHMPSRITSIDLNNITRFMKTNIPKALGQEATGTSKLSTLILVKQILAEV